MNKLTIIGNLTADPQSHTTQEGKSVCNFSVAVNRRRKIQGQPEADFFRIAAWGRMGENCQQYLVKGKKVCVVGQVSVSTYQTQDGTTRANMEVFAEDVEFLSMSGNGGTPAKEEAPAVDAQTGMQQVETDELPF